MNALRRIFVVAATAAALTLAGSAGWARDGACSSSFFELVDTRESVSGYAPAGARAARLRYRTQPWCAGAARSRPRSATLLGQPFFK